MRPISNLKAIIPLSLLIGLFFIPTVHAGGFRAVLSNNSAQGTGTNVIPFATEKWDTDAEYDTSTYKFTPQTAGKYQVNINARCNADGSYQSALILFKNTTEILTQAGDSNTPTQDTFGAGMVVDMNGTTDYLWVKYYFNGVSGTKTCYKAYFGAEDGSSFSAHLLESGGGGGANTLNDLTDVTISGAAGNEILQYDSGTNLWKNISLSSAGALDAISLQGYNIENIAPSNTYVLKWDNGNSQWSPAVDSGGGSSGVDSIIAGSGISVNSATGTVTITNTVSPTISIDTEELEKVLLLGVTSQQWGIVLALLTAVLLMTYGLIRKRK